MSLRNEEDGVRVDPAIIRQKQNLIDQLVLHPQAMDDASRFAMIDMQSMVIKRATNPEDFYAGALVLAKILKEKRAVPEMVLKVYDGVDVLFRREYKLMEDRSHSGERAQTESALKGTKELVKAISLDVEDLGSRDKEMVNAAVGAFAGIKYALEAVQAQARYIHPAAQKLHDAVQNELHQLRRASP